MQASQALTLVEYNRWANGRLMRRAAHLSPEQFHAPCWLSQGSLFKTLIHIADAQWFRRLALQEGRGPADTLTEQQFQVIRFSWSTSRPRSKPLWQGLVHIVNHGTHHRSEAGQYMTTLGRSPGNLDFILYVAKERP